MPIVKIAQKNSELIAHTGDNLMAFLIKSDFPVASSCQGAGLCGKCKMIITPTGQPSALEKETLEKNKISQEYRLACQVEVLNDLSIYVSYW